MIFVIFSNLLSILVTDRRNRIFQQENSKIRNSWALCYVDVSKNRLTDCYVKVKILHYTSQFLFSVREKDR